MLTPEALRAGRAILKWGVREIAAASGVSWMTIHEAENGRPMRASTEAKVIAAFGAEGVEIVTSAEKTGAVLLYAERKVADNE